MPYYDYVNYVYGEYTSGTSRYYYSNASGQSNVAIGINAIYPSLYEDEERIKERKRYPLFFWRETCEPILDLRKKKII